jgi:hypothetical protein
MMIVMMRIMTSSKAYYPFYDVNFILESLQKVPVPLDIRILNLHEETTAQQTTSSVRTSFLCQVLGNAPNACRASRAMDRRQQLATLPEGQRQAEEAEQRDATNTSSTQSFMIPVQRRRANVAKNAIESVMYDVLATTAAAMGLIDIRQHSRRQVVESCQQFHQKNLLNKVLPFTCPTTEQLQALLDLSLQKETDLFQKLTATTTSTRTTTRDLHTTPIIPSQQQQQQQQQHVDSFWRAAMLPNHTNKYCWVDAPAVLQTREWQEMFASLAM